MSRRCHHGSPRHLRQAARERRRGPALAERPPIAPADRPSDAPVEDLHDASALGVEADDELAPADAGEAADAPMPASPVPVTGTSPAAITPVEAAPPPAPATIAIPARSVAPMPDAPRGGPGDPGPAWPVRPPHRPRDVVPDGEPSGAGAGGPSDHGLDRGATAPQLRRFIKSRAYVPMHELRRRFGINGSDDDVIPLDVDRQRVYVGLPPREGGLLGELLRAGDIGYELSLDPIAPIVVGVYPMRPVPRS